MQSLGLHPRLFFVGMGEMLTFAGENNWTDSNG